MSRDMDSFEIHIFNHAVERCVTRIESYFSDYPKEMIEKIVVAIRELKEKDTLKELIR